MTTRCPHCGDKIHDPGADHYCPSCGRDLPHESPDERAIARSRSISIVLLIVSLTLIMVAAGFVTSDLIIWAIDPEMTLMYWPYDLVGLVVGIVLIFVRHPFAMRSRKYTAVLLRKAQATSTCSYCGASIAPGSNKCDSCGAPFRR